MVRGTWRIIIHGIHGIHGSQEPASLDDSFLQSSYHSSTTECSALRAIMGYPFKQGALVSVRTLRTISAVNSNQTNLGCLRRSTAQFRPVCCATQESNGVLNLEPMLREVSQCVISVPAVQACRRQATARHLEISTRHGGDKRDKMITTFQGCSSKQEIRIRPSEPCGRY